MKRRIALFLAVVVLFVFAFSTFSGYAVADEKCKTPCTMHKDGKCSPEKGDAAKCEQKKEACQEKAKEQPKSDSKKGTCSKSCPAASACQKAGVK